MTVRVGVTDTHQDRLVITDEGLQHLGHTVPRLGLLEVFAGGTVTFLNHTQKHTHIIYDKQ